MNNEDIPKEHQEKYGLKGYTGRGFAIFKNMKCSYGTEIELQESSNVEPSVWLRLDASSWIKDYDSGKSTAHLSIEEIIKLAKSLLQSASFINRSKKQHDYLLGISEQL